MQHKPDEGVAAAFFEGFAKKWMQSQWQQARRRPLRYLLLPREFRRARRIRMLGQEVRRLVGLRRQRPASSIAGRIVYVAASSLPYTTVGYTTRTHGVAAGYRTIGYDLHVITRPAFPLDVRRDLRPADVPELEDVDGIPHHRILAPRKRDHSQPEFIRLAAEAIERRLESVRPEVVIAASDYMNALPALIAARRKGLPFVYEVRGMWELSRVSREPDFEHSAGYAISRALEAFTACQADKVLTLTAPMMRDLVDRGVMPANIALMPNGVDDALRGDCPRNAALAARLGLPEGIPVIGYIGSIVGYEGLPDLAAACGLLAARGIRFSLLIVGSEKPDSNGRAAITSEIRQICATNGIADRLFMPGRIPFDEIRQYYSLIDIAPITRRPDKVSEMVSPIKPVEALAMGRALIVSDVEALVDLTQGGRTGMTFRKGDIEHLAAVLATMIQDPPLRARLGQAGMSFVREQRTWPRICEQAAAHIGLAPVR